MAEYSHCEHLSLINYVYIRLFCEYLEQLIYLSWVILFSSTTLVSFIFVRLHVRCAPLLVCTETALCIQGRFLPFNQNVFNHSVNTLIPYQISHHDTPLWRYHYLKVHLFCKFPHILKPSTWKTGFADFCCLNLQMLNIHAFIWNIDRGMQYKLSVMSDPFL